MIRSDDLNGFIEKNRFMQVQTLIEAFLALWPEAEYGFAHIILSDYNLEDHWFDEVLANATTSLVDQATEHFLRLLFCIPEDERCIPEENR